MFSSPTRRALALRLAPPQPRRFLHTSPGRHLPSKQGQDRESLIPESNEYSKSGSDADAAAVENAAFDPNKTRPEQELDQAGKEAEGNPLNVSPANKDISMPRDPQEGGAEGSPEETGKGGRREKSGGGGAPKSGGA